MSQHSSVGILGIGIHLPPTVRTNDWWPESAVASWPAKLGRLLSRAEEVAPGDEGAQLTAQVLRRYDNDPFHGARERRVLAQDQDPSDMEAAASEEALSTAGVNPDEIDLLLTSSLVPDYITVNSAALVHHKVGLSKRCMTLVADAACNSFFAQTMLASDLIRSGRVRKALVVSSAAPSRILDIDAPWTAWVGDGASAVVLGPVSEGRGLLGSSFRSYSENCRAIVTGVPGERWWNAGTSIAYNEDKLAARRMFFATAGVSREVIDEAVGEAEVKKSDIAFYACHQTQAWMLEVTQQYAELQHARSVDTFSRFASLGAPNVPLQLRIASSEGMLRDNDLVMLWGMGSGMTSAAMVMRWGR